MGHCSNFRKQPAGLLSLLLAALAFAGCEGEVQINDPVIHANGEFTNNGDGVGGDVHANAEANGNQAQADVDVNGAGEGAQPEPAAVGDECDEDTECPAYAVCTDGFCVDDACGTDTGCRGGVGTFCDRAATPDRNSGLCACPEGQVSRRMSPEEWAEAGMPDRANEPEECRDPLPVNAGAEPLECPEGQRPNAAGNGCEMLEFFCEDGADPVLNPADDLYYCEVLVPVWACTDEDGNVLDGVEPEAFESDLADSAIYLCPIGIPTRVDFTSALTYRDLPSVYPTEGENAVGHFTADPLTVELAPANPDRRDPAANYGVAIEPGSQVRLPKTTTARGDALSIRLTEYAVDGTASRLLCIAQDETEDPMDPTGCDAVQYDGLRFEAMYTDGGILTLWVGDSLLLTENLGLFGTTTLGVIMTGEQIGLYVHSIADDGDEMELSWVLPRPAGGHFAANRSVIIGGEPRGFDFDAEEFVALDEGRVTASHFEHRGISPAEEILVPEQIPALERWVPAEEPAPEAPAAP